MKKKILYLNIISIIFSQIDYDTEIQPIFDNNCISCHIDGGAYFGSLDLSSYTLVMEGGSSGNTIVPFDHSSSELFNRITLDESDNEFMPQYGTSLSQIEIDLIAQWIDEGALETPIEIFQPQSTQELETAVNLWISDYTSALSIYGDINSWDVSLIWDMSYLFKDATDFNDDISNWDVSNVTLMYYMFHNATSFNQDLSTWDVSNVERMYGMFWGASTFNRDISTWDVSNVTNIYYMFKDATSFNQDISSWDISNTSSLMEMFYRAINFNQDISGWDISNVTNMSYMFHDSDNNLSNENKCLIHTAFSSNSAWNYDWSEACGLSLNESIFIPTDFIVYQNYPNPFNPITSLRYDLPEDVYVSIMIYDMLGNVVNNLVNTKQSFGYKTVQWNATNNQGQPVSAGVYLYSIEAGDFRQIKKMILLK